MRALKIITGHVIYNPAYTDKFQLKTTVMSVRIPSQMSQKHVCKLFNMKNKLS